MSLETRETKLFWRKFPGFCRDIPEVPEESEKKNICVQFAHLYANQGFANGGFQTVVRVSSGEQIRLPPFNLNLTPFYLNFTSLKPLLYLF